MPVETQSLCEYLQFALKKKKMQNVALLWILMLLQENANRDRCILIKNMDPFNQCFAGAQAFIPFHSPTTLHAHMEAGTSFL